MPEIKDIGGQVPILILFVILGGVALKLVPLWLSHRKELKLAKFEVKKAKASAKAETGKAFGQLTETMRISNELNSELKLFVRGAMREHQTLIAEQESVGNRMVKVESSLLQLEPEHGSIGGGK